jgi:flagella basal body P-ring formation protein FlgA
MRPLGIVMVILFGLLGAGALARTGEPQTQVVPAESIAALAVTLARRAVPNPDRALAPAFQIVDQTVPLGAISLVAAGKLQVNASYVGVPIAIDIDGKVARTIFAGFRVTSYVQMVVAAHDLTPGTIVSADDLTYARVPFGGRQPLEIATFVGRKMRSTVAHGDVLYPEFITVNEIVHAGMPALLIVHDGPVRLAADVVARSSGGLGDHVSIYDPQTQRVLSAIVTGPDTVEFALPGAN